MRLHNNVEEFQELVTLASQNLEIEEIYVEKDYFVVLALKSLENSEYCNSGIFKGGTSLSKAYGVINRFSEDIDIAIINDAGDDVGPRKNMNRVENALTSDEVFKLSENHPREKKGTHLRQTVYEYPILNNVDDFGQISKHIFIDVSRISPGIPFEKRNVSTYIYDFLIKSGQENVVDEYDLHPISVNSLFIERTFTEKFGTVVKFASQSDNNGTQPLERLNNGIRHIYDLHMLLGEERIKKFVNGQSEVDGLNFNQFLERVLRDDLKGMRNEPGYNHYMNSDFSSCLLYDDIDYIIEQLRPTYEGPFKRLLFKTPEPPSLNVIKESLLRLKELCLGFDKWKKESNIVFEQEIEE